MDLPEKITCVDCGQDAHLMSPAPEQGWEAGDIVAYRCSGCNDRWDLVVEDSNSSTGSHAAEVRRILAERRQPDR